MIRILIVDDSAVVRAILKQIAGKIPRITICGEAANGRDAIESTKILKPDIIIMDLDMPIMDGIESTKKIKSLFDIPIIIFSTESSIYTSYIALDAGAIEIIQKPDFSKMTNIAIYNLFDKIILIAESNQKKHALEKYKHTENTEKQQNFEYTLNSEVSIFQNRRDYSIVVIGASTGGPQAILEILRGIPKLFPLPIVITQHIDSSFDKNFVEWLNNNTTLTVQLVEKTVNIKAGNVYIAPADSHLVVNSKSSINTIYLSLSHDEPLHFLRPAVDKLFFSTADILQNHSIAIILTGMGHDGSLGMKKIKINGGYTIAQDEQSSAIFGMPKSAIEIDAVCNVIALNKIANEICSCCGLKATNKGVFNGQS